MHILLLLLLIKLSIFHCVHRFLFFAAETSGFGDFGDFSTIPVATGGGGSSSAAPFANFSSFPSQPQQPPPTAPQSDIFADFSSHPMQPSQTTVSTRFPFLYTISPLSLSLSLPLFLNSLLCHQCQNQLYPLLPQLHNR